MLPRGPALASPGRAAFVSPTIPIPESAVFHRVVPYLIAGVLLAVPAAGDPDPASLFELGWYRRAAAALESRIADRPNDAESLALLALCRQEFDDLKPAQALAERAVAANANSAAAHWALAAILGEKAQRANPVSQLGLARRFKKEAEIAARLDPKHVDCRRALIQFHMMAPGVVGGDKKKAEALVAEIAAADPLEGWLARGLLATFRRDTVAMAQAYQKAHEVSPERYEAKMALAQWLAVPWRGPVARVEALALEAQASQPQRAGSYVLLSAVYAYLQRWPDMEAMLAKAEANVPDSRAAHYQAARQMLVDGREPARAEKLLRAYLAQPREGGAPSHAAAHWRLATALEKQGRKADALAELERAVKLDPGLDGAKKDLRRLRG